MGFFDFLQIKTIKKESIHATHEASQIVFENNETIKADYGHQYTPIDLILFNGEKNRGEIGGIKKYYPNFYLIRERAWQAYVESMPAKTIIDKLTAYVVGKGLMLKCEPNTDILGNNAVPQETINQIEARWKIHTSSKDIDSNKEKTLAGLSSDIQKNRSLAGDVLVVFNIENKQSTISVYDSNYVVNPFPAQTNPDDKTVIRHGVEVERFTDKVVAYYLRLDDRTYQRIPAYDRTTGLRKAILVKGSTHKQHQTRGLTELATVLASLAKLERYKEATIASAEHSAKIAYYSTAEIGGKNPNPHAREIASNLDLNRILEDDNTTNFQNYRRTASHALSTVESQYIQLDSGQDLKQLKSERELYFKDFYTTIFSMVSACLGLPYEVVMAMYNSNYSASRAAIMDFKHFLHVKRDTLVSDFLKHYYDWWLYNEIVNKRIDLPQAVLEKDPIKKKAYFQCEFTGIDPAHIDPEKEVKAIRLMLGPKYDNVPLTTLEKSAEALGTGDFLDNIRRNKKEDQIISDYTEDGQTTDIE